MKKAILVLLIAIPLISYAQNQISWDFPIKPGSTEWKNAVSYKERLDLYNIPAKTLDIISTKELIKACLNYPEFRLIFTRNDLQLGYNHISEIFNGFKELESRSDAGKELLSVYKSYNPGGFDKNSTDLQIGHHIVEFTYIELLIAQPDIIKSLSISESNELRIECINKFKGKKDLIESYGVIGLETTALILARNHEKYLSESIPEFTDIKYQSFIKNAIVYDPQILDEIVLKCEKLNSNE
jgi:hypothetical protein